MLNEETGGYHKFGIFLAILALTELGTRPPVTCVSTSVPSGPKRTGTNVHRSDTDFWLLPSIALGSLFFTLHCMFSDSGTIIAWSWTGYENRQPRGPLPHLHGSFTLIAQSIGLLIPVTVSSCRSSDFLTHPWWFAYGCAAAFVMYTFRNWLGFLGGLNFAVFCMSITPSILMQAALRGSEKPGKSLFATFFVAILLYVADVLTVAYAFVPGGTYFRERTGL